MVLPVRSIDTFIHGKCEEVLKEYPSESIDFIITSPPYADQRFYGDSDSKIKPEDYVEWFMPKAEELFRVLKEGGSFVLNINDKVVNGKTELYVYELVLKLCRDIGFNLVRDYIWHNPATPPNVFSRGNLGRCKKSHEYCYWFSKGDSWTFNMDAIRTPYKKGMNRLFIGKGGGDTDYNRPSGHHFCTSKKWEDHGGADPGTVLTISNSQSNDVFTRWCRECGRTHPARFPEKLVEFFILAGTHEGDIVLDPFSGSGTSAVVAARHHRHWIGIDTNAEYIDMSYVRLNMNQIHDHAQNKEMILNVLEPQER